MKTILAIWLACAAALLPSCATSPMGRKQLMLVGDDDVNKMGLQAFEKMKQDTPRSQDSRLNAYVECVATTVAQHASGPQVPEKWEVVVFQSDQVNAFALPGGKIGVYTGLLKVAENQDQLATVLGHEIGHVIARHGNERVSQQMAASTGLDYAGKLTGTGGSQKILLGALGLGVQYGILLPYNRAQETEADAIGIDLMARSGFDPQQSIKLWENMARASKEKPLEILSTHPAEQTRIQNLNARMKSAEALGRGRTRPNCQRP